MSDACIVLGRGIKHDGTLSVASAANVRKATELYLAGRIRTIVMSGKWSYRAPEPPVRTEAAAMKACAIELGVKPDDVLCEEESLDTLGNVYFTKKLFAEPRAWRELIVVAAEEHVARTRYLVEKIYGAEYHVTYVSAEQVLDAAQYRREVQHEQASLAVSRKWLDSIADGDDAVVWQLMQAHHPAYQLARRD